MEKIKLSESQNQDLDTKFRAAQEHALPYEEATQIIDEINRLKSERRDDLAERIAELERKIQASTLTVSTISEFKTLLRKTDLVPEDVLHVLAHENAHANKAESLGAKDIVYNLIICKGKDNQKHGISLIKAWASFHYPPDWSTDPDKIPKLIKIFNAPDEYSNSTSTDDWLAVENLKAKLRPREEILRDSFDEYEKDFPFTEEELKGSLLDVGAHTGEFVQYLREVLHNTDALAVESQLHKIAPEKSEWLIHADGLALPFGDNSFNTVTARNYLPMFVHDSAKTRKAVSELLRVIKPGGRVLGNIATPEGEIESQKELQESPEYDDRMAERCKEHIDGAHRLMEFLATLGKQHNVELIGSKRRTILIITKKDASAVH